MKRRPSRMWKKYTAKGKKEAAAYKKKMTKKKKK